MHDARPHRVRMNVLLAGAIALALGHPLPAVADTPGIVLQHTDGTITVLSVDTIRKLVPGSGTIDVVLNDGSQTTFGLATLHGMQAIPTLLGVGPGVTVPATAAIRLLQNRPNPAFSSTKIGFEIARRGRITLEIFSVAGRRIRTLVDRDMEPGRHEVTWDRTDAGGRRVAAGVYFYQLRGLGTGQARRLVLLP